MDAGLLRGVELGQCNDLRFFEHDDTVVVVAQMEATARASGQKLSCAHLPRRPGPRRPVDGVPDVLLGQWPDQLLSARSALREGDAARLRPPPPVRMMVIGVLDSLAEYEARAD